MIHGAWSKMYALSAILNLRKIVPFIVEGTCLLIIFITAAFLSVPLVSHLDLFFVRCCYILIPTQRSCGSSSNENGGEVMLTEGETYPPSTPNYPSLHDGLPSIDDSSAPISTPELSVLRVTYPTSVKRSSDGASAEEDCFPGSEAATSGELEKLLELAPAKTRGAHDASGLVNYNSYRHKLIEETLQKRYAGGYAPGNVILNLIQLNMPDSGASIDLGEKYDGTFLEHIKPQDHAVVAVGSCRLDLECPDPLAHFIPRNVRKPSTVEMQTETAEPSETSVIEKAAVVPSRPTTPGSCQRILSRRFNDGSLAKSPFPTPVHSQAPLNAHASLTTRTRDHRSDVLTPGRGEEQFICSTLIARRREAPLTEQLYRRNDAGPDVVSKTHVDAEEYLNRIARKKRSEIATTPGIKQPSVRSSLKKSSQHPSALRKSFCKSDGGKSGGKIGDSNQWRSTIKAADIRHLSTSKPTVWNN